MKFGRIFSVIWEKYRIQIIMFIYSFNFYLYTLGFMNLIIQKTCFPDGPPGTNVVCRDDAAFREYNTLTTVRLTAHEVAAGLVVILAGPWRDRTGLTTPVFVLAHVGEMIGCVMAFVSSLMWGFSSWATVIVDSLAGCLGSRMLMNAAGYAYEAEFSTVEERPFKMVLLVVATVGAISVGSAVGGYLLRLLNYSGLMALVFVVYALNMVLCIKSVRDVRRENASLKAVPLDIFRRLKTVFTPRKNFFVIWVIILSNFTFVGLINAESTVTHAFFQKVLILNPEQSGLLQSFRFLASLIIALIATPVFMGLFKLSAFTVSIGSTILCALSCFCMAFVTSLWQAYLAYALDMPRIFLQSMLWTLVTTCLKPTEMGVYASFMSLGDAVIPLFINPIYLFIFNNTIETLPGTFMLVSGCIIGILAIMLTIAYFCYEKIETVEDEGCPEVRLDLSDKEKSEISAR